MTNSVMLNFFSSLLLLGDNHISVNSQSIMIKLEASLSMKQLMSSFLQ
jgi:hypothetical protein